jgi:hypothetical protein
MAEERSRHGIRWATLTNGRIWRLYFHGAASKANLFLGADLDALVASGSAEQLATFLLLFRRDAFVPDRLTPEEVALMWATAPPRMPVAAPS